MTNVSQKHQWELVVDAVAALGGKANRTEVWEYLKRSLPDIPFSTVSAELNSVSVNAPARTSYHSGKQPRRTDSGNRYDRLFKVGGGNGAYYEVYDPQVHGVWEIYPDPNATSTNKTSIRPAGELLGSVVVTLTGNEAKPGNSYFPVKTFDGRFFPDSMIRLKDPDAPARPAHFTTDIGTEFESDIYRNSANAGYLYNRSAARAYYAARPVQQGDRLRFDKRAEGEYHITYLPVASVSDADSQRNDAPEMGMTMTQPINKILFGPPGTGKTYRTVDEALLILDPVYLAAHAHDRAALKSRFDALVDAGLIRFVTFHQSFSYEDFVEGIRATAENGTVRYGVEDGVFKELCAAARSRTVVAEGGPGLDIKGRRIWKVSLGEANTEENVFDDCMEQGLALLGFGYGADLAGVSSRADIVERLNAAGEKVDANDYAVTALNLFVREVKAGDLIVVTQGNLKFRAVGEVTGGYVHVERESDTYTQGRPVRWLRQYDPARPYAELMENRFSQMTIYELRPGSINLERLAALLAPEQAEEQEPQPRVLIIDEINRGNVSRIFGELITLIEPSKREGCAEALTVELPYSKDRFSVPRNVHLIGTMNTADRSLAGLDVALRRRFEFTEMLPDVEALRDVVVEGIPVDALLSTMNLRIEVLLGRDYMLGHAYFMRLKEARSMNALAEVFRRQVLPLLQEYFFQDWQRIAWVLNDHRKPYELQFLRKAHAGMADLFGDGVELPGEGRLWEINEDAFHAPEAYLAIIRAAKSVA